MEGVGLDGRSQQPTQRVHKESRGEGRRKEGGGGAKVKTNRERVMLTDRESDSEKVVRDNERSRDADRGQRRSPGEGREEVRVDPLESDVLLALDVLGEGVEEGGRVEERGGGWSEEDLRSNVGGMALRQTTSTPELRVALGHGSGEDSYLDDSREEEDVGREGGEREGVGGEDTLFSYFSPPKSAGSRHTPSVSVAVVLTWHN